MGALGEPPPGTGSDGSTAPPGGRFGWIAGKIMEWGGLALSSCYAAKWEVRGHAVHP